VAVGDFAAGEVPKSDEQLNAANTPILQIPTVLVAIVRFITFRRKRQPSLFRGPSSQKSFSEHIKTWDDPRIKEINAGQLLPHLNIAVVHRTEGKGSNYMLTDFLSKTSQKCAAKIGQDSVTGLAVGTKRHARRGHDGEGEKHLRRDGLHEPRLHASRQQRRCRPVQNAAGRFISATQASIAAAYRSVERSITADFRVSLTNAPGNDAYPIISFTWLYVPERSTDPETIARRSRITSSGRHHGSAKRRETRVHAVARVACP